MNSRILRQIGLGMLVLIYGQMGLASEFYGGMITERDKEFRMGAVCVEEALSGKCAQINLVGRSMYGNDDIIATFHFQSEEEMSTLNDVIYKDYKETVDSQYYDASFWVMGELSEKAEHSHPELLLPAIVVGGAVDIVKAPVVLVAWAGHRLLAPTQKKKIANLLRFMMDPNQAGQTKTVSKNIFWSMNL